MPELRTFADVRTTPFPFVSAAKQYSTQPSLTIGGFFSSEKPASYITVLLQTGPLMTGWQLVKSLELKVELDSGAYLVSDAIVSMYGSCLTLPDAIKDYFTSLIEYFELVEGQISEEPANQALLEYLSQYIQRH